MLFSKKVQLDMKESYLIERHPEKDFKKGTKVSILKNQEMILVLTNGLMEVIKNTFDYKLDDKIKYLYFASSNKSIQSTNWGTKSRVQIEIDGVQKSLGGYGTIQFRLINPVRYIEKRMGNNTFVTAEMLTDLVLAKIPESMVEVVMDLSEKDKKDLNTLTLQIKTRLSKLLNETFSEMGIELVDLVVTNINLQEVEE
jgi:membrane protease subunit (stomatin/prohibitin family)